MMQAKQRMGGGRFGQAAYGGAFGGHQMHGHNNMAGFTSEDWFEVFISGKGYPHTLANISSKTVKQVIISQNGRVHQKSSEHMMNQSLVVGINQQMLYLHKIDLNVCRGQTYTIYTPKMFA